MYFRRQKINNGKERGFALMFAILASSLLLSISVAIWNIALREVTLSSFGRESQIAFYAADSGAECALYWDVRGVFATSTDSSSNVTITCDAGTAISVSVSPISLTNRSATSQFQITNGSCADVTVTKNDLDGDGRISTKIEALGHNICDLTGPTLVERGFKITY